MTAAAPGVAANGSGSGPPRETGGAGPATPPAKDEVIPHLKVGDRVYFRVRLRKVTPATVTFFHTSGIAQVNLADLEPAWQRRLGYDPAKARAFLAEREANRAPPPVPAPPPETAGQGATPTGKDGGEAGSSARGGASLPEVLQGPPTILEEVDLRPEMRALELATKNQGRRPSCAIFAVVSALELLQARATGRPEKLSEEYLIWGTRKLREFHPAFPGSGRGGEGGGDAGDPPPADAGFSLLEVVLALRSYGIPKQSDMPNTFGKGMDKIGDPPSALVDAARARGEVVPYRVPGADNAGRIDALVHLLNRRVPVVIGLRWPHERTLRNSALLSRQRPVPGYSHAVTLVGYRCASGRLADLRFTFKNSWGRRWGVGGYGHVTYPYLLQHLQDAIILKLPEEGPAGGGR